MQELGKLDAMPLVSEEHRGENWLDRGAFLASSACLIHCLLLPIVVAALPALTAHLAVPELFHRLLLFFIVPTSGYALWLACIRRRLAVAAVLGSGGITMLIIASLLSGGGETIGTVAGSLLLGAAHVLNWKSRRAHCA